MHQDVRLYRAVLKPAQKLTHEIPVGRHVWLQLVRGVLELEGDELRESDGAAISDERSIRLEAVAEAEMLLFDLA